MNRTSPNLLLLFLVGLGFALENSAYGIVTQDDLERGLPDARVLNPRLDYREASPLPNEIGVAGPIVGVIGDSMIVAGGANFARPDDPSLWEQPKKYLDDSWILDRTGMGDEARYAWRSEHRFRLSSPVAYSSVVSTELGVLSFGGEDSEGPTPKAIRLYFDESGNLQEDDAGVPDLPLACTSGGAAVVGEHVYVVAGEAVEDGKCSSSRFVWRLDLEALKRSIRSDGSVETPRWEHVVSWPEEGPVRSFPLVTSQHDGFGDRLYVIGGRRFLDGRDQENLLNLQANKDGWSFDPAKFKADQFDPKTGRYEGPSPWKRIADAPVPLTAGSAVNFGPAHILVPAAATLEILHQTVRDGVAMKDFDHPGFPRDVYAYHTVTDTWAAIGTSPLAQVTTPAVRWGDEVFIVSGEIRPRVRTNQVWHFKVTPVKAQFGVINSGIVVCYLLAMLMIGVYFTFGNRSTDDFFRGGKQIPWWAAGCSIFATMLSSITYMAVPAKAFAQDWVYWIGNFLILGIAPVAIYVALPFFRSIDATSAYEYLEQRFNKTARRIGSGSFSLFHIFRMGVVLALAGLALASVTPLTPSQCVLVMGVLSIAYCTLGGVEAVIWTDTIQTFVLLGGAVLCFCFAFFGSDVGSLSSAIDAGKFHSVNLDFGSQSFATMAIWVVILGGVGQNLSSYTADQAVVQRYMTTENESQAAKSIWLNALMAIPASAVFFAMGTAFWMFYRSHPEKLDPTMASDRILPLFISQELPIGLAGLVVAGIFAAAQSTVSTSMNSGATTIVTDFLRPMSACKTEQGYLNAARWVTLLMGVFGTIVGLFFVDPNIKSLFDQFIGILGMFLGVLAGLFALGVTTRRANGPGSLIGAGVAITLMISIAFASSGKTFVGIDFRAIHDAMGSSLYRINGYLYAFLGIVVCYIVGYLASFFFPAKSAEPGPG